VAGATFATDLDDASALESVEVARGGGPAVGEAAGEVAGGQLGTVVAQEEDELPAGGVGERAEDGVDLVEVGVLSRTANY
jgi:hypothetical protein